MSEQPDSWHITGLFCTVRVGHGQPDLLGNPAELLLVDRPRPILVEQREGLPQSERWQVGRLRQGWRRTAQFQRGERREEKGERRHETRDTRRETQERKAKKK